uniref:Uncharacterized protein n=1 Tax=Oryza nivara TaxID=4536 RepID=A0A0E0IDF7_ORYNI
MRPRRRHESLSPAPPPRHCRHLHLATAGVVLPDLSIGVHLLAGSASIASTWAVTLDELLRDEAAAAAGGWRWTPVCVLVYDAFLLWARAVARRSGGGVHSCAVNVVYGHAWCGRVHIPVETGAIALIGLPALQLEGLPWFIKVGPGPYPAYFDLVMKQFDRLELADDVLLARCSLPPPVHASAVEPFVAARQLLALVTQRSFGPHRPPPAEGEEPMRKGEKEKEGREGGGIRDLCQPTNSLTEVRACNVERTEARTREKEAVPLANLEVKRMFE